MGMKALARTITAMRKQRNLTQASLARRVKASPQSVSRWERGEDVPRGEYLVRLAEVFEVPVNVLTGSPDPATSDGDVWDDPRARTNKELTAMVTQIIALAQATQQHGHAWISLKTLLDMLYRQGGTSEAEDTDEDVDQRSPSRAQARGRKATA